MTTTPFLNPYRNLTGGQWLKGNLHAHTTRSDGAREPQAVLEDYASRGYDFLMLSDHDVFTAEEDYAKLDAKGLVLIPGNEITAGGPHFLHVNGSRRILPHHPRQRVINEAREQDPNSFVIIAHPNWLTGPVADAQLTEWTGYEGIEIYNGTIGRLKGSPYAPAKWDMVLSAGRQVWGFAHDDSHLAVADVGLGWNVVYTRERTVAGITDALRAGRFYASTGVTIRAIHCDGETLRVETENARRIVALREYAVRFAQVDDKVIELTIPNDAAYVRIECWGDGESFAWTQPIMRTL